MGYIQQFIYMALLHFKYPVLGSYHKPFFIGALEFEELTVTRNNKDSCHIAQESLFLYG